MNEHQLKKLIQSIVKDMVVIVDTREQKNQHIIDYFNENGIPYINEKLDSADYSFILPNHQDLGLDYCVLVEKKNSLDELAGNFGKGRDRFEREFERVLPDQRIHLLVENATFAKLSKGSYRSQLSVPAYMASLMTFNTRYNCSVWFSGRNESGMVIFNILRYGLVDRLKNYYKEEI